MMTTHHLRSVLLAGAFLVLALSSLCAAHEEGGCDVVNLTPYDGKGLAQVPEQECDSATIGIREAHRDRDLRDGWPVYLATPGAGFPYTPTLYDADGDGADEIFLTGGHTFALRGDGTFLPGWPTTEMEYMGYGTNTNKPGPSVADLDGVGDAEVLWSERDWWAGSCHMWCFNGKNLDGTNLPNFPQQAPDQSSNALDTPFVLGDTDGDGDLEAWGAHTLGNNFVHYRVSAFDHLGNRLFTVDLNPDENVVSLYFGDLDGDGGREMFAVSWLQPSFYLHAFEADGSEMSGYPVMLFTMPSGGYAMFGPPIPADLDGDSDLEILLGHNHGGVSYARCYHHDGAPCGGFPIQIASSSQLFYLGLGDVTGDDAPELLALENHLTGDYRAFVMDLATGTNLPGWPFDVPDWPKGFPAVADVDNDGLQDVSFVTAGGELYALSGGGQLIAGYPKQMVSASISGVGVGDIDGDGLFELVAATWDGWVYAWDTASQALPGRADWPMRGVDARNTGVFGATQPGTGIALEEEAPVEHYLAQNAPNPFKPATLIRYALPDPGTVSLRVFDSGGRLVRVLQDAHRVPPGTREVLWDGKDDRGVPVASGVYFYRLAWNGRSETKRMVLLK